MGKVFFGTCLGSCCYFVTFFLCDCYKGPVESYPFYHLNQPGFFCFAAQVWRMFYIGSIFLEKQPAFVKS